MPFFFSISLSCSVIRFYWLNRNRFHGYLNAGWWPVGEELQLHVWAWGASCKATVIKVIIVFISQSWRAGGTTAQGLCWGFPDSSSRWRCKMSEPAQTSRLPVVRLLHDLEESLSSQVGHCAETPGGSRGAFKEPSRWQWRAGEKHCFWITEVCARFQYVHCSWA